MKDQRTIPGLFRQLFTIVILFILTITNISAQYSKITDFLSDNGNNIDYPKGDLVYDGTFLYGMTSTGGNYDFGSIFKIRPDGSGFQKLLDFDGADMGSWPGGSLVLSGTTLYGMTTDGGINDMGVIFKINVDGTGFQKLLDFDGANNGAKPYGSLIASGSTLYGMTTSGGTNDFGVIFKINTDGAGFDKLLDFSGISNGKWPYGSLLLSGSTLYGTTYSGGTDSYGVVFKISTNGTGFQKLHDFKSNEEVQPMGTLIVSDTVLYGTTCSGYSSANSGTIFRINVNGSGYKKLFDLQGEGMYPHGSLTLSGSTLYGMANSGGRFNVGILFKINKDGTGFETLVDFSGINDGSSPYGSLILISSDLYGMTYYGGIADHGVVFKIGSDGNGFSKILDLYSASGGAYPDQVITDGVKLYGTTYEGGEYDAGVIYKVNLDGTQYQKIYDFHGLYSEDGQPYGHTLSGSTIYGTTYLGGEYLKGILYKIKTDGTGFEVLNDFDNTYGEVQGALVVSGSTIFGLTQYGLGNAFSGTIFRIDTNGNGLQKVIEFNDYEGEQPNILTISGSILYGSTTEFGGKTDQGIIFKVDTNGNNFQKLVDLNDTNGYYVSGELIFSDDVLYGITLLGGYNDPYYGTSGTIFKVNTDGTDFEKLHEFDGVNGSYPSSLLLVGSTFYGTTYDGGVNATGYYSYGDGVLFKINKDGTGFEKLMDFGGTIQEIRPQSSILLGNTIYGSCGGGIEGLGALFAYSVSDPVLSVSPAEIYMVSSASSNKSFTITSNISWNATSSQSWLSLSDTTGNGNAVVTLTADANPNTSSRTAAITVSGGGITRTINIIQSGITVDLTQAIEETTFVYPNPCSDKLNIKLPSQALSALVSIYSVDGEKILQIEVTVSETEVNMADMKSGIYILQIITSEQTIVERIIKH